MGQAEEPRLPFRPPVTVSRGLLRSAQLRGCSAAVPCACVRPPRPPPTHSPQDVSSAATSAPDGLPLGFTAKHCPKVVHAAAIRRFTTAVLTERPYWKGVVRQLNRFAHREAPARTLTGAARQTLRGAAAELCEAVTARLEGLPAGELALAMGSLGHLAGAAPDSAIRRAVLGPRSAVLDALARRLCTAEALGALSAAQTAGLLWTLGKARYRNPGYGCLSLGLCS